MKRLVALLLTATLLLSVGCGTKIYEQKLNSTLEEMKYQQRLNKYLIDAPTDPKFKDFPLFIRPPKDMAASNQFVMLAELPKGQYDLATNFLSTAKGNLYILGRRKEAKKAPAKGQPPPEPPVPRGKMEDDVIALLRTVYGAEVPELQTPKLQNETKKANQFKRLVFTASNGHVIRLYFFEREPHDIALIWDTPGSAAKDGSLDTARDLALQSFAVGRRAQTYFAVGASGAEGTDAGGAGGPGAETAAPSPF
jgi:hypothetical protein